MNKTVLLLLFCISLLPRTGYAVSRRISGDTLRPATPSSQPHVGPRSATDTTIAPGGLDTTRPLSEAKEPVVRRREFTQPTDKPTSRGVLITAAVGAVLFSGLGFVFTEIGSSVAGGILIPVGIAFVVIGVFLAGLFVVKLIRRKKEKRKMGNVESGR